jgi:hypothetical protein
MDLSRQGTYRISFPLFMPKCTSAPFLEPSQRCVLCPVSAGVPIRGGASPAGGAHVAYLAGSCISWDCDLGMLEKGATTKGDSRRAGVGKTSRAGIALLAGSGQRSQLQRNHAPELSGSSMDCLLACQGVAGEYGLLFASWDRPGWWRNSRFAFSALYQTWP